MTFFITSANKNMYIDDDGILTVPHGAQKVCCNNSSLTGNLKIPDGIKEFDCSGNKLVHIDVPKGIEKLWCYENRLTSLHVPKGVKLLCCSYNNLTSLDVPEGIQTISCSHNRLTSLNSGVLPEGVEKIWCGNNLLANLKIPEGIKLLSCPSSTKLIFVNIPESLTCINILDNASMIYPPKEYHSKSAKETVKYCTSHKIPQRLRLPERFEERWDIIKLMYIAHYKESLDCENFNFNVVPIEVITGIIARYVLTDIK